MVVHNRVHALAKVRLGVVVHVWTGEQFRWCHPDVVAVLLKSPNRRCVTQQEHVAEHNIVGGDVGGAGEVIAIVVFENAAKARAVLRHVIESQLLAYDAAKRAIQRFILADASARYKPAAACRAVDAPAQQYAAVIVDHDQVDRDEWREADDVEKFRSRKHGLILHGRHAQFGRIRPTAAS